MTVMVVGLVNAGVSDCGRISVIMAPISARRWQRPDRLPLVRLFIFAAYSPDLLFAKIESQATSRCLHGFALIFYGLNLMTGGLRPLRNMPEVMSLYSTLKLTTIIN